jgi:fatty-acyl-CoA synthase
MVESGGYAKGVAIAIVRENKDDSGLVHVKVSYPWYSQPRVSYWARVAAPMAGKERGVYFIPEIGDEVPHDGKTLGEICVRGNVVMEGYYDDPKATADAMRGGWFHSGDAAVVHPDGYAEIRDRFKDVIISGGENISSVEVEGVLLRHPAVQEVAVVGLPDAKWGEAPHAFVVLKPGATALPEELRTFTRERLAHFKTPHSFTFVGELPKTATGKIQKFVLRGRRSAISSQ